MKEVLFATDFSDASKAALPVATSLAHRTGAKLVIAHVSEREPYPVGELFDEDPPPDENELQTLQAIVPDDPDVEYEHRMLYGKPGSVETVKPAEAILRCAEKEHVDAIVIGMHGRTGLARLLMGSVAKSVVRGAKCPVITYRQPRAAK